MFSRREMREILGFKSASRVSQLEAEGALHPDVPPASGDLKRGWGYSEKNVRTALHRLAREADQTYYDRINRLNELVKRKAEESGTPNG